MIFSSMMFLWIFLPLVWVGNAIAQKLGGNKIANVFLLLASIFFYAWGEPKYIFLLLLSIILNWIAGLLISSQKHKKIWLVSAILINLCILGSFKYLMMMIRTVNALTGEQFHVPDIALPIGISFYTFQTLSYVIDVYRGECACQKNPLKLALYVSLFPQLIAGPIVKYKDVAEQIDNRKISAKQTALGVRRFVYGLSKKVLISNVLAQAVDRIYALEMIDVTWDLAWLAAIMYTMQIYYDFSGYSDMAIGLGKMFGFEFRENFVYPYTSLSIREFWRKWHISLSSWFKEYVYIPLGGSRCGKRITYENLVIVFFLTGLWHGASWNFVVWGMLHGLMIVLERAGLDRLLSKNKVFAWIYTFGFVNFAWIFFRIENVKTAFAYIKRMIIPWIYVDNSCRIFEIVNVYTVFIIICAFAGMGMVQNKYNRGKSRLKYQWKYSTAELIYCTLLMVLSLASLAGDTYNPFIYFRF